MKERVIIPLVAISIILCLMIPAIAQDTSGYPLTITDSAGRTLIFDRPVERIITLNSDAAEAVAMLGASDKVVAVSESIKSKSYYFPTIKNKQSIGKWNDPNYELIGQIALDGEDEIIPDIIVLTYSYPGKSYGVEAVAEKLAPFKNIKAVGLDFYKPENMTTEIKQLGLILNKESEAQDYIDWYDEHVSNVKSAVKGLDTPKLYVEWSAKGTDLSTMGTGSGFGQLVRMANGFNIAAGLEDDYPKVGWEWVVEQNPTVIIKRSTVASSEGGMGWIKQPSKDAIDLDDTLSEVTSRAAAQGVTAVKNDQVYVCSWDVMAGLDDVVGLTYLAKILHPSVDLDPTQVHREYLERIGLELPENRIFVYSKNT